MRHTLDSDLAAAFHLRDSRPSIVHRMRACSDSFAEGAARELLLRAFWARVDRKEKLECWDWLGGKRGSIAYGLMCLGNKRMAAHRVSWRIAHDFQEIPEGLCIIHSCDRPICVNPHHLRLATHAENTADCIAKGRFGRFGRPSGENHANAKLTWEQVREIRALACELTRRELAEEFGVTQPCITYIVQRKTWKDDPLEVGSGGSDPSNLTPKPS